MSCLLPQFKCQPDTFSIHFKTHSSPHNQISRSRELSVGVQCSLSTTSPPQSTSTAVLDLEKLKLPSLDNTSSRVVASRSCTCFGMTRTTAEEMSQVTLGMEALIRSDEALLPAAAAEAVALAKAAAKIARKAAQLSVEESKLASTSVVDTLHSKWNCFTEKERASILADAVHFKTSLREQIPMERSLTGSIDLDPENEVLQVLEEKNSDTIAVKSRRQKERKAKRARAAKKVASNFVISKSGSSKQKKHSSVQDIDYSDPLHFLRKRAFTSRLLTTAEEIKLSEGIQELLRLERLHDELAERWGHKPTFAQWATAAGIDQKTLKKSLNYGILCKEKLVKGNIRLVMSIANKYQKLGMNIQDLIQEGCRGLLRGAERFDASKGFKFSTYAHWWIKQAVHRSLSDHSRTIRLPFHMVEASHRVREATKQLYTDNGRQPDDEEVAEATGISMRRLSTVLQIPKTPRSLDKKIGNDENLKLSEIIADPNAEPEDYMLMKQFMKEDLEKLLDCLSAREKRVIKRRFGLENGRMNTLQEIGQSMGVSRERIRQIESSAFRKLKNKKKTKHLQQYLVS